MRARPVARLVALVAVFAIASCRDEPGEREESRPPPPVATRAPLDASAPAASSSAVAVPSARRRPTPRAGESVVVPAHALFVGSVPGDEGRDPTLEPYLVPMSVGEFSIDALPYPNDPTQRPRTAVTRAEAARLCAERGARLCTELEWEAACKGPGDPDRFSTGASWDTGCNDDPAGCASRYGAHGLGALRELTSGAIRGASPAESSPSSRRCARRSRVTEDKASDLAFRCCRSRDGSAANDAWPAIEEHPTFRPASLDGAALAKLFAEVPELATIPEPRLFDADGTPWLATSTAARDGIVFTTRPVSFSPEPGADLLVLAGRGAAVTFVVALHRLRDGKHRLAASLLSPNDVETVALAYQPAQKKLFWTSCWMCPGKTGAIGADDAHRIRITLR